MLIPLHTLLAAEVPEIVVTAKRLAPSVNEPAYASTTLSRDALALASGARLDDVLRTIPGFGLFRRQSSRASHPTTQGISLRGLGPSGAGRTLLLLDGIPQNDAFGGWIDWSRLPTASIDSVTVTRGAGAGPWGNAALAGVIRLQSRALEQDGGVGEFSLGPLNTFDATAGAHAVGTKGALFGSLHGHNTDGSFLIRANQRGPVDRRAADRGGVAEFGGHLALDDDTNVRGVARYSQSRFINGLDIAVSKTRIADGAVSVVHDAGTGTAWEVNAYARDQAFSAVFTAVNATRTTVTSSLDQFAVPASAYGANVILRQKVTDVLAIDAGADARTSKGVTNENFQNLGAGFTRLRKAGGSQSVTGVFTELNWRPTPDLLATLGGRVDAWAQNNGMRRETSLQTGTVLRDDRYANRDGTISTVRTGLRYQANTQFAIRAAAYTGFRLPTLNELYRPFRVGNDITEANPALNLERLSGVDLGADWALSSRITLTTTYFYSVLKNAVTNVTIRSTPGLDAATGVVVPAGGVLRQRQNLSRIEANGLEADLTAELSPQWQLSLRYLFTSPAVKRSPQQPGLEGLRLAQVPRHQGSAQLTWNPTESVAITTTLRGTTKQYDDDQNLRILSGYAVADALADVALTQSTHLTFAVENAFNHTIESARSADGLVSVGIPRSVRMGLRTRF